jgi:hypothetical protein
VAEGLDFPYLQASPGVSAFELDGRTVLFCEEQQKIISLEGCAPLIWLLLIEQRLSSTSVAEELGSLGLHETEARRFINLCIGQWLGLGAVWLARDVAMSIKLTLGDAGFLLSCSSKTIRNQVLENFGYLISKVDTARPLHRLDLIEYNEVIYGVAEAGLVFHCEPELLPTAIKAAISSDLIRLTVPFPVLHAACLIRDERALIICGPPGVGKTTLSLVLEKVGFRYAGDDLCRVTPNGHVRGIPLPRSFKSGAWRLAAELDPAFGATAISRRPDGRKVRFLPPIQYDERCVPTGMVVFLERRNRDPLHIRRLTETDALGRLVASSHAPDRKMRVDGILSLKKIAATAPCVEFAYRHPPDAIGALTEVFDAGR